MNKSLINNNDFLLFCQLTKIGNDNTLNHINFYKSFKYLNNGKKFLSILKNKLDLTVIELLIGYIDESIIPCVDEKSNLLDLTINDVKIRIIEFTKFEKIFIKFIDTSNYNYFLENIKDNEIDLICEKDDCKILIKINKEK